MRTLFSALLRRQVILTLEAQRFCPMSRSRKWRSKESSATRQQAHTVSTTAKMAETKDYSAWSQESLIERVAQLENELKEKNRRLLCSDSSKFDLC